MVSASELSINTNVTASDLADAIFGDGIEIKEATYTGDDRSSGIFSDGLSTSEGVVPSDSGVILSTGKATDFTNSSGQSNQSASTSTNTSGQNNLADLNAIAGARTYDASVFEAKFVPDGNILTMQFVFSSEEYPEYVGSGFNDAVGIWVNGQQAELTAGDSEVSINAISPTTNSDWYIDNTQDQFNTEMDGFTVTLSVKAPVKHGEENTIRIAIADGGDSSYDSNLLIAGDSVQTVVIANNDELNLGIEESGTLDVLANDILPEGGTLTITHINGQEVTVGETITLSSGVELTLTEDGTIAVVGDDEGSTSEFTYTVSDGLGNSDIGYGTINTVPCFLAGTVIDTALGPKMVEKLSVGDLVRTRDNAFQAVRWVGLTMVRGFGRFAPVHIDQGTFGNHGRLTVSPQHRLLLSGVSPRLMFSADEVLVPACHLVNGRTIRQLETERVWYVHLLFDQHEVVQSNGLWSESYLPGPQSLPGFDADAQAEIGALFPNIDAAGKGYGPAARRCLRRFETRAMLGAGARLGALTA
ncbi:2,3,4,5-tetrahydropyridine-2,6-carboxylate N-succinyltransferase [Actibacterium mucosum KCTC 23349]|uniref:2,3,4,5-tetrahydropyridine-2,6-carboxylate N-succinyltransferase n=1 Tax=Actibacterium mucosum KCTC 23349 TaxID=1454373 RepID=A0A037ZMX5_9RHOB|nr:choice-of-anchor L domain-containing protein [Actibacterium mucosum]KAJ57409.1 2,3,4,5-tetrahydropyridine-2,6-carboxylate N-succinyltransferase [Actibacterium mucosum KCTC 23349]